MNLKNYPRLKEVVDSLTGYQREMVEDDLRRLNRVMTYSGMIIAVVVITVSAVITSIIVT